MDINNHFLSFLMQETNFSRKSGPISKDEKNSILWIQRRMIKIANYVYQHEFDENGVHTCVCPVCGETFTSRSANAKYCSDFCRRKAVAVRNYQKSHDLFDQRIEMPLGICNALIRANVKSVGKLTSMSKDELLKIRGLGFASVKDIEVALKENGLSLRET